MTEGDWDRVCSASSRQREMARAIAPSAFGQKRSFKSRETCGFDRPLTAVIEETFYQGRRWVVFEPDDGPLQVKMRINMGRFRVYNGYFGRTNDLRERSGRIGADSPPKPQCINSITANR